MRSPTGLGEGAQVRGRTGASALTRTGSRGRTARGRRLPMRRHGYRGYPKAKFVDAVVIREAVLNAPQPVRLAYPRAVLPRLRPTSGEEDGERIYERVDYWMTVCSPVEVWIAVAGP